jgi:excisionase family DNA binding protein
VTEPRLLTSAEAARVAGVGPSSVKRWADLGLLPCVKTAGGHRRIERAALMRFLREQAGTDGGADPETHAWVERLVAARRHEVDAALIDMRARLGAWHRVADALGPVIVELGRRWQAGLVTIADEHVASECLTRALGRVGDMLPSPGEGPRCLLACVEGDDHTLGLSLAELCVRELGWLPVWLGRRTPRAEILRMVHEGRAEIVALSASAASCEAALLASVAEEVGAACRERGAALVLGGTGAWPSTPGHGSRLASFADFHDFATRAAAQRARRRTAGRA